MTDDQILHDGGVDLGAEATKGRIFFAAYAVPIDAQQSLYDQRAAGLCTDSSNWPNGVLSLRASGRRRTDSPGAGSASPALD